MMAINYPETHGGKRDFRTQEMTSSFDVSATEPAHLTQERYETTGGRREKREL